ncbi:carnitine 3-dehydrogenase [Pseudaestuariivita sp.]|uniref:carnitine 3-dehydrogenase n=1 Tax=Pseudaestuariivita sp. TaxID=2211669 RepID=UPI004058D645
MQIQTTAAIIGGGVIGGGWAARFLLMGWDVRVYDPDPEAERKIGEVLAGARRALPMLYDVALPPEGNLTFHDTIADAVTGATWVQESVPERLPLKHKVLAEIIAHAPAGALVGSSTSGFKPSELQEGSKTPDRILVTHPFNPVYLLPLVELVGSSKSSPETFEKAQNLLTDIGFFPLRVEKEIDAHIADRFLEAVWREALWLIKDGIATTAQIDEAIRMGFGLRWAQMGLFETYRIAGGEAGMRHFIEQFGPALAWPWTKLMDVPDLDAALIDKIAAQSDAQSGHLSIRELERLRDDNLVALLRALRQQGSAAGAHLNHHEKIISQTLDNASPLETVARTVPVDWTDYNGHMNEGRYGQVFSDAADSVMRLVGADQTYIDAGLSYFTVETTIKYLAETHAGADIKVTTQVIEGAGKKLKLHHEMMGADGTLHATCTQMLIHVSLETRRSCPPRADVMEEVERLAATHGAKT